MTTGHWRSMGERGAVSGMIFTIGVYRFLGRGAAEIVLWFVVTYFFLTGRSARHASRDYLDRLSSWANRKSRSSGWEVHRHFFDFAQTSLDRFDLWAGSLERYSYRFFGQEHLQHLLSRGQGAVLLGAHFGSIDFLRALPFPEKAKVHFLMDQRGARKFYSVLKRFCPRATHAIIDYDEGEIGNVLRLKERVSCGEFVGLLADRNVAEKGRRTRRFLRVPFLGSPASFPEGPFLFAALMEAPVLFIAAVRRNRWEYELHVERLAEAPASMGLCETVLENPETRKKILNQMASNYVRKLESFCLKTPRQWFNFYNFWRD